MIRLIKIEAIDWFKCDIVKREPINERNSRKANNGWKQRPDLWNDVLTLFGPGVMDHSVGEAPDVRLVPSDVRKMLSFLKAAYENGDSPLRSEMTPCATRVRLLFCVRFWNCCHADCLLLRKSFSSLACFSFCSRYIYSQNQP